jgi:hypothetical protein
MYYGQALGCERQYHTRLLKPQEKTRSGHWIGGLVKHTAGMDAVQTGNIVCLYRESIEDFSFLRPTAGSLK